LDCFYCLPPMTAQIPISKISLYDRDFQLWIETTVNQLRQEDFASVDWTNLIEELASMGKNIDRLSKVC